MSEHEQIERIIGLARKRLVAQTRDGWVSEGEGYFLFAAPHPSRVIVNGAWIEADQSLDKTFQEEISTAFARLGHDFSLYVPTGFSRVEASLQESAFVRRVVFPTLRLDSPIPFRQHDGSLNLVRVQTADDLTAFIGLCAECFEFSKSTEGLCRAVLGDWIPTQTQQAFLLRREGIVAAVAMVLIVDQYAVIDWVATRSAFRRRGFGAMVTEAAIQAGFESGATCAVLHSSASGVSLYHRLGFREIGAMALYSPA